MNLQKIVKKLVDEIKGKNRKDTVSGLEELLSEDVEELSTNENFFNLPLNNIFSVISKVDFNDIKETDNIIEIIQNIIKNTIMKHFEEKETLLILQNLNISALSFSFEEIFSLLELITNCPILSNFCNLYKEQKQLPDKDYEFELQKKEDEIAKLNKDIEKLSRDDSKIYIQHNSISHFKHFKDIFISMPYEPADRIEDIKSPIDKILEINGKRRIQLYYGYKKLERGNTLQDYNIKGGAILWTKIVEFPNIFYIKTLTGKKCKCEYSPDYTLLDLKQMIQEKLGIPQENQIIICQGKRLENDNNEKKFSELGIEKRSTIHAIFHSIK